MMDEVLDGTLEDRGELEQHLAGCEACRRELDGLRGVQEAVARSRACQVDGVRLQRASQRVLEAIGAAPRHHRAPSRRRGWVLAACVGVAVGFCAGLSAGRSIWPREITSTKAVARPRAVERTLKVEVPVISERVVVKRAPVVKTRVVYRDRGVRVESARREVDAQGKVGEPAGPVKANEVVVSFDVGPIPAHAVTSRQVRPAAAIGEGAEDDESPEPERERPEDVGNAAPPDENRIAQKPSSRR